MAIASATQRFFNEIDILLRARYPIIYIVTHEEGRLEKLLIDLSVKQNKSFKLWSATQGLNKFDTVTKEYKNILASCQDQKSCGNQNQDELFQNIEESTEPSIFYCKDFGPLFQNTQNIRHIKNIAQSLKSTFKTLILSSPLMTIPIELEKEITVIDLPLPDHSELLQLLKTVCEVVESKKKSSVNISNADLSILALAAQGLTMEEAENVFSKAVIQDSSITRETVKHVTNEKRQIIKKSGVLEFYPTEVQLSEVGGLSQLKKWLSFRKKVFLGTGSREAELPIPKGLLLLGAPGSGKSLTAKAIASEWQIPLLKLDFGKIFSGYVGSSEENMRKSLKLAESLSPVVLWIDEIEKGLAGGSQSNVDGGVAARILGTFLTWMQEKSERVFVVATANRIENLPPELLRKGRFDEIFFSDLPNSKVREEIFKIHLTKRKKDYSSFDIQKLVAMTEGFSGSEIEQSVIEALYSSYHHDSELKQSDLESSLSETVPLSVTYKEDLEKLRQWSKGRARHAELPQDKLTDYESRFSKLEIKKAS